MEDTAAKIIKVSLIAMLVISGCAKQHDVGANGRSPLPKEGTNLTENVTQQVETFTLSSVGDDSDSNWQLDGESADILEDKVNLKNVRIKSQSKGAHMTMTAKKGVIKKNEDKGVFKEDVVFAYEDGTTLSTDMVDWSFKKQIANATGNTKMNTCSGSVIKCSGPLTLDYKKNIAIFNKDVLIENEKGKMSRNKMVVFFDPARKKLDRVDATGDVKFIRGNSISLSDRAVYFADEGKAVLTGNPIVFVDSDEARKAAKQ